MMQFAEEEYFVKTFIRKEKQERLLHELTDEKRQYAGLERFCHQTENLLDQRKIRMKDKELESKEFARFVKENDVPCLFLSPERWPARDRIPLGEAVREASISADAAIVIGNGFAIVFEEAMKGGRGKYLLAVNETI